MAGNGTYIADEPNRVFLVMTEDVNPWIACCVSNSTWL